MNEQRKLEIIQFKTSILLTARKIAAEKGWVEVSMRNIARELNVSAPLLYSYFQNKETILRELEKQGFKELNKRLKSIRKIEKNPKNALVRMTLQIFEYAVSFPEMYQVMFNLEGVKCGVAKKKLIRKASRNYLLTLSDLEPNTKKAEDFLDIWWSMVQGYIMLLMSDKLQLSSKKARKKLDKMANSLITAQFGN